MILRLTHEIVSEQDDITLIFVAAPEALSYYPAAGFKMISEDLPRQRCGSHASADPS
jgi:hypothetical protein